MIIWLLVLGGGGGILIKLIIDKIVDLIMYIELMRWGNFCIEVIYGEKYVFKIFLIDSIRKWFLWMKILLFEVNFIYVLKKWILV